MRTLAIIVLTAIVGTVLGWLAALAQFRLDVDKPLPPTTGETDSRPVAGGPGPRIQVAELEFNFGSMQRGTRKSHQFAVKNTGTSPLTIRVGHTTCKCTLGVASDAPIAPGDSADVRLEWVANADPGPFRQLAGLLTNDPEHAQLSLNIIGEIIEAHGVEPADFLFDKVTAGQSKSASVFVMAMFQEDISVEDPQFTNAETRDHFDVRIEPVARAELPNQAAKAGVRVTVTVKPDSPLGFLGQRLRLRTNLADAQDLEIPIVGRVVGDISVHGAQWDDERSIVQIGSVRSSAGSSPARLNILVRGQAAPDVKLNVVSCDPPELKVSIGEPKPLSPSLVQVPLDVSVPPGMPPMVHLGTDQGDFGRIILGTTHPTVHELRLNVRFSVER